LQDFHYVLPDVYVAGSLSAKLRELLVVALLRGVPNFTWALPAVSGALKRSISRVFASNYAACAAVVAISESLGSTFRSVFLPLLFPSAF